MRRTRDVMHAASTAAASVPLLVDELLRPQRLTVVYIHTTPPSSDHIYASLPSPYQQPLYPTILTTDIL